ncbi:hypothetical protein K438DRAFT_2168070 [Mycena galopus ATCC 62051]|nr:hypothetical protein K438DRAFT_2168070 [Mycena galopus ATCC 62051]
MYPPATAGYIDIKWSHKDGGGTYGGKGKRRDAVEGDDSGGRGRQRSESSSPAQVLPRIGDAPGMTPPLCTKARLPDGDGALPPKRNERYSPLPMAMPARRSTRNQKIEAPPVESPLGVKTRSRSQPGPAPKPRAPSKSKRKTAKKVPQAVEERAESDEDNGPEDPPEVEEPAEANEDSGLEVRQDPPEVEEPAESNDNSHPYWASHDLRLQERARANPALGVAIARANAASSSLHANSSASATRPLDLNPRFDDDDNGSEDNYSDSEEVQMERRRLQQEKAEAAKRALEDPELELDGGAQPEGDHDDDDDEEEDEVVGYDLIPGPLAQADKDAALVARKTYQTEIREIAQRAGKKVSAVLKAIRDLPVSMRDTNPWNAHQAKYRIEHPKPRDMSNADYAAAKRAACYELFEHLSGEELTDPLVRADATAELMTWYRERQKLAVDKRKAAGHGMALLRKVAEPFIHQSTSISNTYNIDIFGYAVDRFTDTAHIWGGSKPFSDANAMYPGDIQQDLFDWKARLRLANFFMHNSKTASNYLLTDRNVQMEHRRQANAQDEATQAMHIDFTKVKNESNRDGMRRQLSRLFLNQICTSSFPLVAEVASGNPVLVLIMLACEDHDLASIQNLFKKGFPWKWTAIAHRHKLHFEGWPAALKSTYPGPGFDLSHIKDSDAPADASRNKAMRDMHTTLKAIYLGTAEDDIQYEQELDDPRDVAIVTCDDGTTLLTAAACTKLLRDLAPAKPGKRKAAADESAAGPSKRARTSPRPAPSRTPTPSRSPMPTPPASRSVTPPPRPRQVPDSPAAEEPSQADFPSSLVPNRINCVYVNGNVVSSGFLVSGFHTLAPDEVPDEIYRGVWYHSNVTQALKDRTDRTLTWRHFATVGNEQWRKLPTSLLALWCGFLKQERHVGGRAGGYEKLSKSTTIVNYLVPGARAAAPARTASRERQPTLKEQLRLVQSLVTQWFPFNGGRGNYEIETRPDQHLVLVMRHPDLPTGDLSPLPYPQPADEQESSPTSALCCVCRPRADAFFEFHAEMAARVSIIESILHVANDCFPQTTTTEFRRIQRRILFPACKNCALGFEATLGPRALGMRELTYGGSLRYRVKPTGFGYWCSATADDSPLAILDSIMAAEAKTAVLAVADARVAAEKALFLASTAQLAHTDTVGALVALRQAQARASCQRSDRCHGLAGTGSPSRIRPGRSHFSRITWKIFEGDRDYSEVRTWDFLRISFNKFIPGTGPPYPGDYVVWALRHPWDRIMSCISLNVPFANNK